MASMTGVSGWITIPATQEAQAGPTTAKLKCQGWSVTMDREIFDDSSFEDATNARSKACGMAGLRGTANCLIDMVAIPSLTGFLIEDDAGGAFILNVERVVRSLDFTGLITRMSFSLRKDAPVRIGVDFVASGAVSLGTAAFAGSNSTGATLYGTKAYMTFGTGSIQNATTLNVEELDFEVVREALPDDFFDATPINWHRYIGGMYHLTGRARGPMIAGQPFSFGVFGTVFDQPATGYVIKMIDCGTGTDGTYSFYGTGNFIGYSCDKAGRTIVEVGFESSGAVAPVQPIAEI